MDLAFHINFVKLHDVKLCHNYICTSLRSSSIGDEEAVAIAAGMKSMSNLKEL